MPALGTTYITSSAALFLALEDQHATRGAAGSSRDAAATTEAEQVASGSTNLSEHDEHHNIPIRFRRYLRSRHAQNTMPSGSRDADVGGPQSQPAELEASGSCSTDVAVPQGEANTLDATGPRVQDGEPSQTSRSDPPRPKNKGRSHSRKASAQPSNGAAAKEKAEPTRRSKRLEGRKAPTPETASDSQSGTSTPDTSSEQLSEATDEKVMSEKARGKLPERNEVGTSNPAMAGQKRKRSESAEAAENAQVEERPRKKSRAAVKAEVVEHEDAPAVDPPPAKVVVAKTRARRPRKRKSATRNGQ